MPKPKPAPRSPRLPGRELLAGAAALGLMIGLGWACEDRVCELLANDPAALGEREAALDRYLEGRCEGPECESIEQVSQTGCRAKVRVIERRADAYGAAIGTFRVDEGLQFSPIRNRWELRETVDVKQLLGLPTY